MTRHWSVNGRFLSQPPTGVQRYAAEILAQLDDLLSDDHPLTRDLQLDLLVPSGVDQTPPLKRIEVLRIGRLRGHAWEQLELPRHIGGGLLSLCNTGPLAAGKHIVCIHDANTRTFPSSYSASFRILYRALLPTLAYRATRVATVSHYSAAQLVQYGISRLGNIDVIPDGHEHVFRWFARHSTATLQAAGPKTVVVVGSPAPHKNVGLVLGLASELTKSGIRIAVAGSTDRRVFRNGYGKSADVIWLGRLTDGELAALLSDALCLAFPSFEEGFGLPPLEAMALGCPVIASNRASMPEICGDGVLFASPEAPADWLAQILLLASEPRLRLNLIERGRRQSARFSWRTSAMLYLQAMARADRLQ